MHITRRDKPIPWLKSRSEFEILNKQQPATFLFVCLLLKQKGHRATDIAVNTQNVG